MSRFLCNYAEKRRIEQERGAVPNFCELNKDALSSLKVELQMSMTVSELQLCQDAYRKIECRDPSFEELYFLDAIAHGNHHSKDFASVARVSLDNAEAARSHQDLLRKRTLLAGRPVEAAPSLTELSQILSRVLERSGKTASIPSFARIEADPYDAILAAACGFVPMESISVDPALPPVRVFSMGDGALLLSDGKARENDSIILVRARENENDFSVGDALSSPFLSALSLFSQKDFYRRNVHACRVVDRRGVAVALSLLSDGAYVQLSALPSVFDDGELYDLALLEHGALLVAVSHEAAVGFLSQAEACGLFACRIARAVRGSRLHIRMAGKAPISLSASFLRRLGELRVPLLFESIGAAYENDVRPPAAKTDMGEMRVRTSLLLAPSLSMIASAAGSKTLSFGDGVVTALLAVFGAVLAGADPSRLWAHDLYVYPEKLTARSMGGLYSVFLGAYRVFAELAIPNTPAFLPPSPSDPDMSGAAVYCFDNTIEKRTERFTGGGTRVYMAVLPREKNGFYDFGGVRLLLRFISENRDRLFLSAGVGSDRTPREVAATLCGKDTEVDFSKDSESLIDERIDGVFLLLESPFEVKGFRQIGTVQKRFLSDEQI